MTVERLLRTATPPGDTGAVVAMGLTSVLAATLAFMLYAGVSDAVVGTAALMGAFAGNVGWSWFRHRMVPWRRRPQPKMRVRLYLVGWVLGGLFTLVALEVVPIKSFVGYGPDAQPQYAEYPERLLLLITVGWLVAMVAQVTWAWRQTHKAQGSSSDTPAR